MDLVLPSDELFRGFLKLSKHKRPPPRPNDDENIKIPEGVEWDVWRLVFAPQLKSSLHEIETLWSYEDYVDAHILLDIFEEAQNKANKKLEAQRKKIK